MVKTTGMVVVAPIAAFAASVPNPVTNTSGLACTSSAAICAGAPVGHRQNGTST